MLMTKQFQIIHKGIWHRYHIVLNVIPEIRVFPDWIKQMIEDNWQKVKQENPLIYNGIGYSLIQSDVKYDKLVCKVQSCSYKDFLGTNVKNIHQINDHSLLANSLAACVVIKTADNCIVVGKRSRYLAEGVNEWHVIGGTLESMDGNPEDPFDLIYKEIEEELGIKDNFIQNLHCTGLGLALHNYKPEFLMYCNTILNNREVTDLYHSASHQFEHDCLDFIPIEKMMDFIRNNKFSPIGLAAISSAGLISEME
ncbi:MAG TPA: NUDIX hydrolase [Candidatus Cloacimonadota bacterium]|nr:NUDIX hydrolase [Candidatus Cloacimonadota bacterium]